MEKISCLGRKLAVACNRLVIDTKLLRQRPRNEVKIDAFMLTRGKASVEHVLTALYIFRKKEALPLISANDVISLKGCPVTISVFNNSDNTDKTC